MKLFDLRGRTALITGAAGLLGVEHAEALLEVGAKIVLTDIDVDALNFVQEFLNKKFDSEKIILEVMNVTKKDEIDKVANNLWNKNLHIDILVNNAAIDPKFKADTGLIETSRLENFPLEQWNLQIAVGLTGAFLCSQVFGSAMARGGKGGVILNIASDLSLIAPDQRLYNRDDLSKDMQPVKPVTYSVIKSGLIGLTKYLATYWPLQGVRCNALSPGGVFNGQSESFVNKISDLIPMGRMANKDEYRSAVQFLCSDSSSYMNGQNLIIDGGRSVW